MRERVKCVTLELVISVQSHLLQSELAVVDHVQSNALLRPQQLGALPFVRRLLHGLCLLQGREFLVLVRLVDDFDCANA